MRSTRFSDRHLSNVAFVQFSSVQDGTCTLGKAHNYVLLRSFPNVAFLAFSSVRFKMTSIRSEKPVCVLPVSQTFSQTLPVFSSVQFSSRWHLYARKRPYALYPFLGSFPNVAFVQSEMAHIHRRSENPIIMLSTPSLRRFPSILFQTVPVFV